jgi:hypothetical protein
MAELSAWSLRQLVAAIPAKMAMVILNIFFNNFIRNIRVDDIYLGKMKLSELSEIKKLAKD